MFWRRVQQPEEAEKEQPTAGSSDGSSSVEVEEQQEAALKMLPIKASVGGVTRRFCVRKALGLVELREEMDTYFGDNMPESIFHFEFMVRGGIPCPWGATLCLYVRLWWFYFGVSFGLVAAVVLRPRVHRQFLWRREWKGGCF